LTERCAFANVYNHRCTMHPARTVLARFGKTGDQIDRQVIDAVVTEVFESFEN
jgi:hypothetical protein